MATDPKNSVEGAQAAATQEVISAFGGLRPMGKKLGVAVSTLQGWQSRGQIPASRADEIAAAAEREDIDLATGVLEAATGQSGTETGGEAAVRSTPADSPETPSGEVAEAPPADAPLTAGAPEAKASAPTEDHTAEEKPSGALEEGDDAPAHTRAEVAETRTTGGEEAPSESLTGSAAGDESPPPPQPAPPPERGTAGTVLIGALFMVLGLVIAAAILSIWEPWSGSGDTAELESGLAGLQQRTSQLEEQVAGQGPGLLQSDIEGLIEESATPLSSRLEELGQRLQALQSAAEGGADAEAVTALRAEVQDLSGQVANLSGQLSDLSGRVDGLAESSGSGGEAALVLAITQLRDALRVTAPYGPAVAAVERRLGEAAAGVSGPLETLKRHAANGIPTRRVLAERFPAVAGEIASAGYAEDESWYGSILRRVNDVVSIRPVGEDVAGQDPGAVAARAEAKVKAGDLRGAVAELEGLSGAAAEAASGWLADAQARLTAEEALADITAAAADRLAPSGSSSTGTQ